MVHVAGRSKEIPPIDSRTVSLGDGDALGAEVLGAALDCDGVGVGAQAAIAMTPAMITIDSRGEPFIDSLTVESARRLLPDAMSPDVPRLS
jgi:hypothetical protein